MTKIMFYIIHAEKNFHEQIPTARAGCEGYKYFFAKFFFIRKKTKYLIHSSLLNRLKIIFNILKKYIS